jgi:hypothetical protein
MNGIEGRAEAERLTGGTFVIAMAAEISWLVFLAWMALR